jgi:hypothetical protein
MPASAPQRPVSISLVAVPEVSAAIVLSLHEVFTYVGVAWEALTGDRFETRSMVPCIVGRTAEPMRTTIGAMLVPDHTFAECTYRLFLSSRTFSWMTVRARLGGGKTR